MEVTGGQLDAFRATQDGSPGEFELFRLELYELVLVRLGDPADHLVVESWHPATGLRQVERR